MLSFDASLFYKLFIFKAIVLFLSLVALLVVEFFYFAGLFDVKIVINLALGFLCLICFFLLFKTKKRVSEFDAFILLASDIAYLSTLIYLTGGTSNPFSSSILVPLALAITLLSKKISASLTLLCIAVYAFWTFTGDPHAHNHLNFQFHLYGMWGSFLISAVLLFFFIAYAMDQLKKNESLLSKAREKILRDEQLVSIATLSASTAHSIGTPLSTMSLLLEDVQSEKDLNAHSITILKEQVSQCRKYLRTLVEVNHKAESVNSEILAVTEVVDLLQHHVNLLFPLEKVEFITHQSIGKKKVEFSQTLFFAMANVIDNAIQAANSEVKIVVRCSENVFIKITDDGKGFSEEVANSLGKVNQKSEKQGWGVGIFLTHATIEQAGGQFVLLENSTKGATVELTLPLWTSHND